MAIFSLHQAYLSYSDAPLLDHIDLQIEPGERLCLVGRNGAGKSTLLKIMAGVDTEFDGEARPMPDLNIGYLPQEPQLDPEQTVRESVETPFTRTDRSPWTPPAVAAAISAMLNIYPSFSASALALAS